MLVEGLGPASAHRAGRSGSTDRPARPVTADQVTDAVLAGSWVVDLRDSAAYARGHLPGSVNVGWSAQFATHVGWLVPWEDDIVLLTDSPDVLAAAVRDLSAMGIDGVDLHVLADEARLTASHRVSDWSGYRAAAAAADAAGSARPVLVDVRRRDEHDEAQVAGAVHVPVQDIEQEAPLLPPGELWVHCRSGYRAGVAASVLHRMGRSVVHVDDAWERVGELDLPVRHGLAA